MFYGLNKFIKNILPKRLFYRALLIVAVPVIVLQLVITVVFFDSLWIKTNKGMTRALINEISTFVKVYDNKKTDKKELTNIKKESEWLVNYCKTQYETEPMHFSDKVSGGTYARAVRVGDVEVSQGAQPQGEA